MSDLLAFDQASIDWAKMEGLVPAIVQDARTARVLMLGYMNQEALAATVRSGHVTFFSRSKQRLWEKGESSGNVLVARQIRLDCDGDALLVMAEPAGPTCHTGARSCFGDEPQALLSVLGDLEATIRARHMNPPEGSYTASLFNAGFARMAQKVGEEGVEVALAGALDQDTLSDESADLLYHLMVLLIARGKSLADALAVLKAREGQTPRAAKITND